MASWSEEIQLLGAGGEPVDFPRTLLSHGVADLPPNQIAEDGSEMEAVLQSKGRAWRIRLHSRRPGRAAVGVPSGGREPPASERAGLLAQVRHMLRLDEDLSAFYVLAAADPTLS